MAMQNMNKAVRLTVCYTLALEAIRLESLQMRRLIWGPIPGPGAQISNVYALFVKNIIEALVIKKSFWNFHQSYFV